MRRDGIAGRRGGEAFSVAQNLTMAGKGARTYEYKKPNPGGARREQYVYVHPQLDRGTQQAVHARDESRCRFTVALLPGFQPPNPLSWRYRRRGGRMEVHHLVRLEDGGNDELNNLTSLCKRHHAITHQALNTIARAQTMRPWPRL
jgi:HNH endonuclease